MQFSGAVMTVSRVLFTLSASLWACECLPFGWSAGQIVRAIWKEGHASLASLRFRGAVWCWCPTPPSIPGSPQDGCIRISHSTVNLNGLIYHSTVTEGWERQRERAWEERERDADGCFFNIRRNWILHYLTCAVSQAAPRLLMACCNRIGSVFWFFNFAAVPRC